MGVSKAGIEAQETEEGVGGKEKDSETERNTHAHTGTQWRWPLEDRICSREKWALTQHPPQI